MIHSGVHTAIRYQRSFTAAFAPKKSSTSNWARDTKRQEYDSMRFLCGNPEQETDLEAAFPRTLKDISGLLSALPRERSSSTASLAYIILRAGNQGGWRNSTCGLRKQQRLVKLTKMSRPQCNRLKLSRKLWSKAKQSSSHFTEVPALRLRPVHVAQRYGQTSSGSASPVGSCHQRSFRMRKKNFLLRLRAQFEIPPA